MSAQPKTVAQVKSKLLRPATTSHFYVSIGKPFGLDTQYLRENGIYFFDQERLNLMCSEAVLPGSSLATFEFTDFHGVQETHAYRRIYDDRIDLTFYVDEDNYLPIRFFEVWMKYVVGEEIAQRADAQGNDARPGSESPNYYYRMNYPEDYMLKDGLSITKFERSYTGRNLTYKFINVYPFQIASMPVSYDASSLLKCTVSFKYIRYIMLPDVAPPGGSSGDSNLTPEQQALQNAQFGTDKVADSDAVATSLSGSGALVGGSSLSVANASGNSVSYSNSSVSPL